MLMNVVFLCLSRNQKPPAYVTFRRGNVPTLSLHSEYLVTSLLDIIAISLRVINEYFIGVSD